MEYIGIENIKDKQKILLYIFEKFHNFCVENNLVYNAFGGTLLGCIRHKGFIPWDDDVDVAMPRNDYDKFISMFEDDLLIVNKPGDKNYPYYFSKLCLKDSLLIENELSEKYKESKIYMDIFPVDYYPKNEKNFFRRTKIYERILRYITYKPDKPKNNILYLYFPLKIFIYSIFKVIPERRLIFKQIELVTKNKDVDSNYLFQHGAGWTYEGRIEKTVFYNRGLYKFENINIYGVKDYDKQLKKLYGDYMIIPPQDSRQSNHSNIWKISSNLYEKLIK